MRKIACSGTVRATYSLRKGTGQTILNTSAASQISSPRDAGTLPEIPGIDAHGERPHIPVLMAEKERIEMLIAAAHSHYGKPFIGVADRLSRNWLKRNMTPYLRDVASIAHRLPASGGWFLNASFEWSCTCGVAPAANGRNMRLVRVLDWPLDGLGKGLVVTRQSGRAGNFFNITWPGFAGVVTGCAPGRFAAAINQAPLKRAGLGCWGDWAVTRPAIWRSRELPPMHLLRQIFEQCGSYRDAKHAITHSPLAVSAIFSLAGAKEGEGCVIERTPTTARVFEAPVSVANHWIDPETKGRSRGVRSHERRDQMANLIENGAPDALDWLDEPVLNRTTRLAAIMDPADGALLVKGFEGDGPATRTLHLAA